MLSAKSDKRVLKWVKHYSVRQGALFIFLSLLTACFAIFLISWQYLTILKEQDRNFIDNRLLGYWLQYRVSAEDDFIPRLKEDFNNIPSDRASFLRIADEENETLFLAIPAEWQRFSLELLEQSEALGRNLLIIKSADVSYHLMAGEIILSNGYRIQTGISTENRDFLLTAVKRQLFLLILIIFMVSSGAALLLTSRALKPIRIFEEKINEISLNNAFHKRIASSGTGDSFDSLGKHFNLLLQKVEDTIKNLKATLDNTAHDLRTPLTRIRGTVERAIISENSQEKEEALLFCLEETQQLTGLINTLMDLSEAEQGLMKLTKTPFLLNPVLNELLDLFSYTAEEKGIKLSLTKKPDIMLTADKQRFQQAVGNLLDNAVKYCQKSDSILIDFFSNNSGVTIQVSDTGPGIPSDESHLIWDRLYRGEKSRSEKGAGLGLSLVKAVMSAHGGNTKWEANQPRGSRFILVFPKK